MNFLKVHVLLKQLERGVMPDKKILVDAIEFARKYRNVVDFDNLCEDCDFEDMESPDKCGSCIRMTIYEMRNGDNTFIPDNYRKNGV